MSDLTCPSHGVLTEERVNRVLTQYRESPKLLHVIRTYLKSVEKIALQICDLPSVFDIETAVGDQLTILGKRMGWTRCHCICDVQPVFGFDCETEDFTSSISGFCDDNVVWNGCVSDGIGEICIFDDEIYRKFLKVRAFQITNNFDWKSLNDAVKIFWGPDALIVDGNDNRVVITPGRELTESEIALIQLYPRVLPTPLGVSSYFHFDSPVVFGFGEGWGGFCEEVYPEGAYLNTDDDERLITNSSDNLITDLVTIDAPWMCEIDVNPYSC